MLTRQKSLKSRTRRARRKQNKFLTPDLALFRGQKLRFVAGPDDPLSEAERVRAAFAQMVADHHAEVGQFLQHAYGVATQFRRRPGDFKRFQVHPFWKQTGQKPRDPSTTKWVLYLIMQATTTHLRPLADKYAVILDGLMLDQVEVGAVAARIKELGGIDAAREAMQVRKRGDPQVSGTVAVAETAAASPRKSGASLMLKPTQRPRKRRPQPAFAHPSFGNLFAGHCSNPALLDDFSSAAQLPKRKIKPPQVLAVEEIEEGCAPAAVPPEAAFDFVQRLAREYAKIKDGDHQSVRRVLQRAYFAALKMQCEPGEFARLQADPFWKASFYKPQDASTSKWVVHFIMQARTLYVRHLAAKYAGKYIRGLFGDKIPVSRLKPAQRSKSRRR
jgi:hypothetical protein